MKIRQGKMTRKYIKEEKLRYLNTNPSYDNIESKKALITRLELNWFGFLLLSIKISTDYITDQYFQQKIQPILNCSWMQKCDCEYKGHSNPKLNKTCILLKFLRCVIYHHLIFFIKSWAPTIGQFQHQTQ